MVPESNFDMMCGINLRCDFEFKITPIKFIKGQYLTR